MEQMQYNLLFRWFVGLGVDDAVWVPTVFTKNRDRLLTTDIARKLLAAILSDRAVAPLLSDEHFSVDGTLIEAWASMKSFKPKVEADSAEPPAAEGGSGESVAKSAGEARNLEVDFHGEKRSNETPRGIMENRQRADRLRAKRRHQASAREYGSIRIAFSAAC